MQITFTELIGLTLLALYVVSDLETAISNLHISGNLDTALEAESAMCI